MDDPVTIVVLYIEPDRIVEETGTSTFRGTNRILIKMGKVTCRGAKGFEPGRATFQ